MESRDNKYFKWYWSICERAKDRILESSIYTEKHHIYPKGIYGQNKNLVKLTAKEHYIVHLLLWRGFRSKYGTKDERTRKMASAFSMMNCVNNSQTRYKIRNCNEYSLLRIASIESKKGKIRPKFTDLHRKRMSDSKKGKILPKFTDLHRKNMAIKKMKRCYQWNISNGELVKEYESIKDASIKMNVDARAIKCCIVGKYKTSANYFWSFHLLNEDEIIVRLNSIRNKSKPGIYERKIFKKVYQYALDHTFIKEYESVSIGSKLTNIKKGSIASCANGAKKTGGGFIWRYEKIENNNE